MESCSLDSSVGIVERDPMSTKVNWQRALSRKSDAKWFSTDGAVALDKVLAPGGNITVCAFCSKSLSFSRTALIRHYQSYHGNVSVDCPMGDRCGFTGHFNAVEVHVESVHPIRQKSWIDKLLDQLDLVYEKYCELVDEGSRSPNLVDGSTDDDD